MCRTVPYVSTCFQEEWQIMQPYRLCTQYATLCDIFWTFT